VPRGAADGLRDVSTSLAVGHRDRGQITLCVDSEKSGISKVALKIFQSIKTSSYQFSLDNTLSMALSFPDSYRRRPSVRDSTAPATPSGYPSGSSYTHTTSGSNPSVGNPSSISSFGATGTASPWLGVGSASHFWNGFGTYQAKAQARSAPNPSLLSSMSNVLVVAMH
jgi:hypothetical protein